MKLIETINTVEAKGAVEKWLLTLEDVMLRSIRDVIDRSREAYANEPRQKWVLEWPGQVIYLILAIQSLEVFILDHP